MLGLGAPLLGDDGVGRRLLQEVRQAQQRPEQVRFVYGGTWGLSLLPHPGRRAGGRAPRDRAAGADDAVPRWCSGPLSPHQIDLRDVLAAAELLGCVPRQLVVVGVQPAVRSQPASSDELHVGLSAAVDEALVAAMRQAGRVLEGWVGEGQPGSHDMATDPLSGSVQAN